ncbi:hypothetical protein [Paenibacillus sp. BAC0078]
MRIVKLREMMITAGLLLYSVLGSGCAAIADRPAAKDLNLALAGMDGSDAVSFEGASSLQLGGKAAKESALYFGGNVADHNKVSLYSLLPDGSQPKAAAETAAERAAAPAYHASLEKKDGEWMLLPQSVPTRENNPLPALNPIRQLEELERLEKTVTEEAGAVKGTRVLRIELTNDEARSQLSRELAQEMQAIRPAVSSSAGKTADKTGKVSAAMLSLWEQKDHELQQKLKQVSVKAVYYLKVDTKSNLPKQLTWARTISYPGTKGTLRTPADETYLTQVNFYGYR